jgi:hypothetical protein
MNCETNVRAEFEKVLGNTCIMCNYDDVYAIERHHVNESTKKYNMSSIWSRNVIVILSEIIKTIPLCSNCHAKVHALENTDNKIDTKELYHLYWIESNVVVDLWEHLILDMYKNDNYRSRRYRLAENNFKKKLAKYMVLDNYLYTFLSDNLQSNIFFNDIQEYYDRAKYLLKEELKVSEEVLNRIKYNIYGFHREDKQVIHLEFIDPVFFPDWKNISGVLGGFPHYFTISVNCCLIKMHLFDKIYSINQFQVKKKLDVLQIYLYFSDI